MSKAKFAAAKELIDEKQYDEARAILRTIDHPTAKTWLDKLDSIDPPAPTISEPNIFKAPVTTKPAKAKQQTSTIYKMTRGCLIVLVGLIVIYLLAPSKSSAPTPTPTLSEPEQAALVASSTAVQIMANATASVITLTPPTATATITDTPLPTATDTPTLTPTATATPSTEERATKIINEILISDLERISILEVGSPKLLAIDFPMAGLLDYKPDYSGHEMLKVACALYKNGFTPGWRYQMSAMIDAVNTANGQTFRMDGLTIRVSSETVSTWNCNNTDSMDIQFAADEYILDPIMNK